MPRDNCLVILETFGRESAGSGDPRTALLETCTQRGLLIGESLGVFAQGFPGGSGTDKFAFQAAVDPVDRQADGWGIGHLGHRYLGVIQ